MENNTCHGQCYLMQKLKNQQEKEQQSFKVNFQEGLAVVYTMFSFDLPMYNNQDGIVYNLFSSNLFPREYIFLLDRPPLIG